MRGRGSNPKSRANLVKGINPRVYIVCNEKGFKVSGPHTWGRAYDVAMKLNRENKSIGYGIIKE
jgi:hypothetical protein